jgi:hypothetical protein
MKDVFTPSDTSSDTHSPTSSIKDAMDTLLQEFPNVLQALIRLWGSPTSISTTTNTTYYSTTSNPFSKEGEVHNKYAIQDQILQILNPLILKYPYPILTSMLTLFIDIHVSMDQVMILLFSLLTHYIN